MSISFLISSVYRSVSFSGKFWEVVSDPLALRVQDKEPSIRVQAVLTICTFLASQAIASERKEVVALLDVIVDSLCSDPSAYVPTR